MCPRSALSDRLARVAPGEHLAHLFASSGALADTVAHYSFEGLARGQGVVLLVVPETAESVRKRLRTTGVEVERAEFQRILIFEDAEKVVERVLEGGDRPDRELLRSIVGDLVERARDASASHEVRLFGHLVQVLQNRRQYRAAARIEKLCDRMVEEHHVALLCGYSLTGPDGTPFPDEFALHHAEVLKAPARQRLLEAARELFAGGYSDTTTAAIARQAGSSESQIAKHFGNKQGLLRAIFDTWWSEAMEELKEPELARLSSRQQLLRVLDALFDALAHNEDQARVLLFEGSLGRGEGTVFSQGFLRFGEGIEKIFANAAARGALAEGYTPQTARDTLLGGCGGLLRSLLGGPISGYPVDYGFAEVRTACARLVDGLVEAEASDRPRGEQSVDRDSIGDD